MKIFEMTVAYRLQSEDLQLYYNRVSESFFCLKNVCYDCDSQWYHSINQCVFCGTENYFVWICSNCNSKVSLTNSNPNPCICGTNTLLKLCFNDECQSRTDDNLNKIILKNKNSQQGIFHKKGQTRSGFTVSQQFCKSCGSERNYYKKSEIKVFELDDIKNSLKKIFEENKNKYDTLIFVNRELSNFITMSKGKFNQKIMEDIDVENII